MRRKQRRKKRASSKYALASEEDRAAQRERMRERVEGLHQSVDFDVTGGLTSGISTEEREAMRLARIKERAQQKIDEHEALLVQLQDPATFDRLQARNHFGTYAVDAVLRFRRIIQEVDKDNSGEIDKHEFMHAIEKLHEHEMEVDTQEVVGGGADGGHKETTGMNALKKKKKAKHEHGDAHMTFQDLANARDANREIIERMVDSMFASLDDDASGTVSIPELVGVLFPKARDGIRNDIVLYMMMPSTPVPSSDEDDDIGYTRPLAPEIREELRQLFDIYDLDKSGALTVDELRKAMSSAFLFDPVESTDKISSKASAITTTDFERIVQAEDKNGDCEIDFEEWCQMMRHFFE